MTKEEISKLHRGDVVYNSDGTIVKIHHIGADGRVFYEAFVRRDKDGLMTGEFNTKDWWWFWGYARECTLATAEQKTIIEKWIREHERKNR